jgi:hypothetical protein
VCVCVCVCVCVREREIEREGECARGIGVGRIGRKYRRPDAEVPVFPKSRAALEGGHPAALYK